MKRFRQTALPAALLLALGLATSPRAAVVPVPPAPPPWLFSRGWDVVRLVARGTDPRAEAASVSLDADAGLLILR